MEKRWKLYPQKTNSLKEQLLINRNLTTKKDRVNFLHPHFNQLVSGFDLFPDLKKAIARIKNAIKERELIYIYGDYDVDGLTATAILWETLDLLGAKVLPYIPSRQTEGYGLNSEALVQIAKEGAKLVISVDCGITALEQAEVARKLKLDLIITDHHQAREILPNAFAILHTTSLAGCGIAFKLAHALLEEFGKEESEQSIRNLELATIGTVADMVPLVGESRIIVKNGLFRLGDTPRLGLKAVYEESGIGKNIGTYEIGHIISPRLNAMGRLESALDSLRLLLTRKKERAKGLAILLSKTNKERQEATVKSLEHAKETVTKNYNQDKLFVVSSSDYPEGVVGLVAGRLTEEFYRPSAVISERPKVSKGSARSIRNFNITNAIGQNTHLLISHGGHPMAAGFSLEKKQIPFFREAMLKIAEENLKNEDLQPVLKIDAELAPLQINQETMDLIKEFEPFGIGNPEPVFLLKSAKIIETRIIGKDSKHIRLTLEKEGKIFEGVGFNLVAKKPETGVMVDLVFNLRENFWNSRKRLELRVIDVKPSE